MVEETTLVEVVRKRHRGIDRETGERVTYIVGDTFEATAAELAAFPDRLIPVRVAVSANVPPTSEELHVGVKVPDSIRLEAPLDITAMSIKDVLLAIEKKSITPVAALSQEEVGNKRKTLIAALKDMISEEDRNEDEFLV